MRLHGPGRALPGSTRAARLALGFCLAAGTPLALAETPVAPGTEPAARPGPFDIPYEKYELDNGLEVILHVDPTLPRVAVSLWYHVGPANEPPGRSGFAHLFEHLMFEGSKHAGRSFDTLLESVGATNMNGTTSFDRTNYFETVRAEHLELSLWLESDRMGFLTLSEERLEVQREVVQNERRQSYENRPYGPSELLLYDTLFPEGHAYHGNVIGSMHDLEQATLADASAFHAAYYAPSNATLALVGDIDVPRTRQLVERYFGSLPKLPRPERRRFQTPPLAESKRLSLPEDVGLAQVSMAWIAPPAFGSDEPALELATEILASGKASRLYRALVSSGLCTSVNAWLDDNELASIVGVDALVSTGVDAARIEGLLEREIGRMASEGPTAAELARAQKGLFVSLASSLQLLNGGSGESGRAGVLQKLNHYLGDPGRLPAEMARVAQVTPEQVRAAIALHLSPDRRLTVVTVPQPATANAEGDAP